MGRPAGVVGGEELEVHQWDVEHQLCTRSTVPGELGMGGAATQPTRTKATAEGRTAKESACGERARAETARGSSMAERESPRGGEEVTGEVGREPRSSLSQERKMFPEVKNSQHHAWRTARGPFLLLRSAGVNFNY